jgi:Uma2 family endonuclease
MATVVKKFGPADHGRPLTYDDYLAGDYEGGHRYELIDGRLYVSPEANQPENFVQDWLRDKLKAYARARPEVLNHVTGPGRLFVPAVPGTTTPEPDVLAYRDYPRHRPLREIRWQDISPVLVAEVLSAEDPDKDLVRNPGLYLLVPSIKEYWVLDGREDPERPSLRVHRRRGKRWVVRDYGPDDVYTTRLLPGFELTLNVSS